MAQNIFSPTRELSLRGRPLINFIKMLIKSKNTQGIARIIYEIEKPSNLGVETKVALSVGKENIILKIPGYGSNLTNTIIQELKEGKILNIKNVQDRPIMHYLASYDSTNAIINMVKNGANVNIQDGKGRTPLHVAIRHSNDINTVRTLIALKADSTIQDDMRRTPLHVLGYRSKINQDLREDIVKHIISHDDRSIDMEDCFNDKPLIPQVGSIGRAIAAGKRKIQTILIGPTIERCFPKEIYYEKSPGSFTEQLAKENAMKDNGRGRT